MIEIIPHNDSFRGSYNVTAVVDTVAYLYIYNEIFVQDWNQYIKKFSDDSHYIKSKFFIDESETTNDVPLENLSHEEKIKCAKKVPEFFNYRHGKKGRYFEKLANNFDNKRRLITCHKSKFYIYEITSKFADFISIYLFDEDEIEYVINHLFLKIKKRNRISTMKQLISNFEIFDED